MDNFSNNESQNFIDSIDFRLSYQINSDMAWVISEYTKKEDKLEPKTPEQIIKLAENGCYIAFDSNDIFLGCIFMTKYNKSENGMDIYERGLLYVNPNFRKHWLGTELMKLITAEFKHKSIISVSSNIIVEIINIDELWFNKLTKQDLPKRLIDTLQEWGDLYPEYKYFVNESLLNTLSK